MFKFEQAGSVTPEKEDVVEVYRNRNVQMPISPREFVMFADARITPSNAPLRMLSFHHRSVDIGVSYPIHEHTVKIDGDKTTNIHNVFTQIDLKGAGFIHPETFVSRKDGIYEGDMAGAPEARLIPDYNDLPWGYDVLGLLDERVALAVKDKARQLSKLGLRTEAIAGIYRLNKIFYRGEFVATREFKAAQAERFDKAAGQAEAAGDEKRAAEYRAKKKAFLADYDPVMIVRLVREALRLRDFVDAKTREERLAMLEEVCRNLNIENQELKIDKRFSHVTKAGREDLQRFVARSAGKNAGILHGNGEAHLFMHMGNWTLAGEVVDLDSVGKIVGESKSKKPVNEPFSTPQKDGKTKFVGYDMGQYRGEDAEYGLPKGVVKDLRDSGTSVRLFLTHCAETFPDDRVDNAKMTREYVDGYLEGFGGRDPLAALHIGQDKIIETMRSLAERIIAKGGSVAPVPADKI